MKPKKQNNWGIGKGFAVMLPIAAAYVLLVGGAKVLRNYNAKRSSDLETEVVQPIEAKDVNDVSNVNELNDINNLENKINFSEEDLDWLTKGMYGEARGELAAGNIDYVRGYAKTVITRAKRKNKSIKDTLLQTRIKKLKNRKILVYQYTCFDSVSKENRKNYQEVQKPTDLKTFELCKQVAKKLLEDNNFPKVTNYYVGKPTDGKKYRTLREIRKDKIPSWAFEMKGKYFERDKEGYFIPRTPTLITPVRETKRTGNKAYFYNFKYF